MNPEMPQRINKSNKQVVNHSGSLEKSEPEFLEIGKIGKSHGLHGAAWMDLYTDFPERLVPGKIIYLGEDHQPKTIRSFSVNGSRGLIGLNGIESPESLSAFKNKLVYVKAEHLPELPEGQYYHHDLIGMLVIDENQKELGKLAEILQTGSNDVYVVIDEKDTTKETLIPAIKSSIINIDVKNKTMTVRLQEWV